MRRERERKSGRFFYFSSFLWCFIFFLIFQMELLFCVPKVWGSLWDIVQVYLIISFYINETAKKKYVILIKLLWNNNNVSLLWTNYFQHHNIKNVRLKSSIWLTCFEKSEWLKDNRIQCIILFPIKSSEKKPPPNLKAKMFFHKSTFFGITKLL